MNTQVRGIHSVNTFKIWVFKFKFYSIHGELMNTNRDEGGGGDGSGGDWCLVRWRQRGSRVGGSDGGGGDGGGSDSELH